jgi:dolichyl-phosphate-mannose-protein mannosyltransferase
MFGRKGMNFHILLMILTIVFLAGCAVLYFRAVRRPKLSPSPGRKYGISRRDGLWMLLITIIYAAVAFFQLGSAAAPQTFCVFPKQGAYVEITLNRETKLGGVYCYCGVGDGSYYFQGSTDGVNYTDLGSFPHTYNRDFKWGYVSMQDTQTQVRYLRIIADSPLRLGELRLYGGDDKPLPASSVSRSGKAAALFDEQSLAPKQADSSNSTYFDEVYHARTAYEHLHGLKPYEISHPPLGKILIGLGIRLFGMTPFGWRFIGCLFGVLMLPLLFIFLKDLFGNTLISCCGTLIFAFDFMHFTQTRIATIDTYAVFFILLSYWLFFRWLKAEGDSAPPGRAERWLALSGIAFGIGAACKWTVLYGGMGLGVLWLAHWTLAFRGKSKPQRKQLLRNIGFCLVFFVAIPAAIYYLSYIPYGAAAGLHGPGMLFSAQYARIVWDNQVYMLTYHSTLRASHPYASHWYQWLLDLRPIVYYRADLSVGTRSEIAAMTGPLLCWGGLAALGETGWQAARKNRTAAFLAIGYLAQLVPWIFISRETFAYHYFACTVFLTLAVCFVLDSLRQHTPRWSRWAVGFTAACLISFVVFYPILSGRTASGGYISRVLCWLPGWTF